MKYEELPTTAEALNRWLHTNFQCLIGPPRGFFELPIDIQIGEGTELTKTTHKVRVVYIALSLQGTEEACCREIAHEIRSAVPLEAWQDAREAVFIRTPFEKNRADDGTAGVFGRLAFWRESLNRKLMQRPCYKREGALSAKAGAAL